jgi:hypothetical protein
MRSNSKSTGSTGSNKISVKNYLPVLFFTGRLMLAHQICFYAAYIISRVALIFICCLVLAMSQPVTLIFVKYLYYGIT